MNYPIFGPVEPRTPNPKLAGPAPTSGSSDTPPLESTSLDTMSLLPGLTSEILTVQCPNCGGRPTRPASTGLYEGASRPAMGPPVTTCLCRTGSVDVRFGVSILDDQRHLWIVAARLMWPLRALCGLTAEKNELIPITIAEDDDATVRTVTEGGDASTAYGLCLACAGRMLPPGAPP